MNEYRLTVRLTFLEGVLGTHPANEDIFRDFIGSKAPDADTIEDEVSALGVEEVSENKATIFLRTEDGNPFLYDY